MSYPLPADPDTESTRPAPPPLPDNATPEEKELHWYRYVYQGDTVKQLSVRAVVMGGVLGMFMSISNLYTTLKLGWAFGVAITSCVLSYVIWNGIRGLSGNKLTPMTLLENNCMQSTASAAGYSTGGTIATAFGALLLMTGAHASWPVVLGMTFFIACLGVFLAIPMKRQMINVEQLQFPSGIAAAETLRSLYSRGGVALKKAYSLLAALGGGVVIGFFRGPTEAMGWLDRIYNKVHIPELLQFPRFVTPLERGTMQGYGFEPGALMIAAGMFVGLRVSLSMLAGSVLLYCFVSPWLVSHDAAMAATVANYVPSFAINAETGNFYPVRWALWGGTSLMVFSSLTAVAVQWKTVARSFNIFKTGGKSSTPEEYARVEVPNSWFLIGLVPISIGLVAVSWLAFSMNVFLGLLAIAMSFVLALVACRATGETDTTPIGAMGKVAQLTYAVLARGNVPINLMSANITAGAATSSADLLTDLKSGYLLGANARKQFIAQFAGIFFGMIAVVPAWYLMVPNKEALEKFNPPATNMWRAVAEALTHGIEYIPITARWAILGGALLGVLLPLVSTLWPKSAVWLPSAMGLGLSWVVPFQNSLSFAIGALIAWGWAKINEEHADTYVIPVASGLVAGESMILALIAIGATVAGFMS